MAVYPRHKALVDEFIAGGHVIGIGPFSDRGNMAIFRTQEAAERFVKEDPFRAGRAGQVVRDPPVERRATGLACPAPREYLHTTTSRPVQNEARLGGGFRQCTERGR
jgi:hypothetical protein